MHGDSTSYLRYLLGWGLPVVFFQILYLKVIYGQQAWQVIRLTFLPVGLITAWLVVGDSLAIQAGIWRFGHDKTLGFNLISVPFEEILFFLITNFLIAFGFTLFARRLAR